MPGLTDVPFPADYKLQSNTNPLEAIDYARFKYAVLRRQIEFAEGKGRFFTPSLASGQLDAIEPGQKHQLIKSAATHCRALIDQARADLAREKREDVKVGIASSYRSVERETQLWDSYFDDYYKQTAR